MREVNLWEQYVRACEDQARAAEYRDRTCMSWHASERDKARAVRDAAAAARRCVEALQAYRQDLLSGMQIIERDDAQAGSVVPWWEQDNTRRAKQELVNGYDKLSDRSEADRDRMLQEIAGGDSVVEVASKWRVSIAAVTVMATYHGALKTQNEVETQRKAKKKYKWKYTPPEKRNCPRFVRDDSNVRRVAELVKEGAKRRDIADRLGVSHATVLRASRLAKQRGYLPDDPPLGAQAMFCTAIMGIGYAETAALMQTVRGNVSNYVRNARQRYPDGLSEELLTHCEQWYERVKTVDQVAS